MNKKDLEYALGVLKQEESLCLNVAKENNFPHAERQYLQHYQTAIQCIQNELDNLSNKPLSLEELSTMRGKPVWIEKSPYHWMSGWGVIRKVDIDKELVFTRESVYEYCDKYKFHRFETTVGLD